MLRDNISWPHSQNGESEDFAAWLEGFATGIDARLATVLNDERPLHASGASEEEDSGAVQDATFCRPTEVSRTERPSDITCGFEDDGFQLSASTKACYMTTLEAMAGASHGEGEGPEGFERVVRVCCGDEQSIVADCAREFSSQSEGHVCEAVQQAMGFGPLGVDGRQEEDGQAGARVTARSGLASGLNHIVALLTNRRIRSVRRAFSAIYDVGLEAVVHAELRESEISSGFRLMGGVMRRRNTRAKLAALRRRSFATASAGSATTKPRLAALSAIVRRKNEKVLRRAFTSLSDYGLEIAVRREIAASISLAQAAW